MWLSKTLSKLYHIQSISLSHRFKKEVRSTDSVLPFTDSPKDQVDFIDT